MLMSDKAFSIIAECITLTNVLRKRSTQLFDRIRKQAADKEVKKVFPLDKPGRFMNVIDTWRRIPKEERQESPDAFLALRGLLAQYGGVFDEYGVFKEKGFLNWVNRKQGLGSPRLGPRMRGPDDRVKPEIQEEINALWMEIAIGGLEKKAGELRAAMMRKIKERGLDEGLVEGNVNDVLSEEEIQKIEKYYKPYFLNIFKNQYNDNIDEIVLPTKTFGLIEKLFDVWRTNKDEISDRVEKIEGGGKPDLHQIFIEMLDLPVSSCGSGKWMIGSGPCIFKSKLDAEKFSQDMTVQDLFTMMKIKFPAQIQLDAPVGGEDDLKLTDTLEGRELTPLRQQEEDEIQAKVNQAIESLYQKLAPSDEKKAALIKKILNAEFDLTSQEKGVGDAKMTATIFGNELLSMGITESPEILIDAVEAIATNFVNETEVPLLTQSGMNKKIDPALFTELSADPRWEQIGVSQDKIDPLLYLIGQWFSAGNGYWAAKGAPNWKNSKHHKIKTVRREALLALMGDPSFQEILPIPQLQQIYKDYQANPQDKQLNKFYNKFDNVVWEMIMRREAKAHSMLRQSSVYMNKFMAYIDATQERYFKVASKLHESLSRRSNDEEMIKMITRGINDR